MTNCTVSSEVIVFIRNRLFFHHFPLLWNNDEIMMKWVPTRHICTKLGRTWFSAKMSPELPTRAELDFGHDIGHHTNMLHNIWNISMIWDMPVLTYETAKKGWIRLKMDEKHDFWGHFLTLEQFRMSKSLYLIAIASSCTYVPKNTSLSHIRPFCDAKYQNSTLVDFPLVWNVISVCSQLSSTSRTRDTA